MKPTATAGCRFLSALSVLSLMFSPTSSQGQVAVYLPFGWADDRPVSATNLGLASAGDQVQTVWGLYERPLDQRGGPATLFQTASDGAYIVYSTTIPSTPSAVTRTYTGPCAINSPVAVCGFEVPSEDIPSASPTSSTSGTSGGDDDDNLVQEAGPSRTGSGVPPLVTENGAVKAETGILTSVVLGIAVSGGLLYGVDFA